MSSKRSYIHFTSFAQGLIDIGQAPRYWIDINILFLPKNEEVNYIIGGVGVAYRENTFDDSKDYELFTGEHCNYCKSM